MKRIIYDNNNVVPTRNFSNRGEVGFEAQEKRLKGHDGRKVGTRCEIKFITYWHTEVRKIYHIIIIICCTFAEEIDHDNNMLLLKHKTN